MTDAALQAHILDSLVDPVLVADIGHTVIYMNSAAVGHYTGGESLMGTSLLELSQRALSEGHDRGAGRAPGW
ncbi:MAG: hypothetical protein ABIK85_01960 [Candidatus Eisenbacteria bacterium]